jgi:hypothetical protein
VNATIFNPLRSIGDGVASHVQLVVFAFVNIVELYVCYGVVYAADYMRLHGSGQPATGFYLSVITQLTIGFGDVYPTGYLRAVAAAQGLLGLAFFILDFARVVASLPQLEETLQPPESAPNSRTPPRLECSLLASSRCRGLHHTRAASRPLHVGKPCEFVVES